MYHSQYLFQPDDIQVIFGFLHRPVAVLSKNVGYDQVALVPAAGLEPAQLSRAQGF